MRHKEKYFYLVFWIILALRILQSLYFFIEYPRLPALANLGIDTPTYIAEARRLAAEGLGGMSTFQPPLYILLLTVITFCGLPLVLTVKIFNLFCALTVVFSTWKIGKKIAGDRLAWLSGILCMAYTPLWAYVQSLQYELFATALISGSVALAITRKDGKTIPLISPLCLGLAILVREPAMALIPVIALLEPTWLRKARFSAIAALIPSLWIAFLYYQHGQLIPISSKGAVNFLMGWNPNATGGFNLTLAGIGEPSGWDFIRAYPSEALILCVKKLGLFFGFYADGWYPASWGSYILCIISFGVLDYQYCLFLSRVWLPALGVLGVSVALLHRQYWRELLVVSLIPVAAFLIHLPFISSPRFLIPFSVPVFILAAVSLLRFHGSFTKKHCIAVCVPLMFLYFLPFERPFRILLEAEDMEGERAMKIPCDTCSAGAARLVSNTGEKQLVMFYSDQTFPSGHYRIIFTGKHLSGLHVEIYDEARRVISREPVRVDQSTSSGMASFDLPRKQSVAIGVRSREGQTIEVDTLQVARDPQRTP